ncbi:hypothetical protein HPP92_013292 [Vanilla planifolia]|uniref:RING-type E3 ubiquitin transferase n=1 Tax=Vanilla planifolia TaxID=51239 RepID=A0A835QN58_VANPL|nr:hypothetical protein HPP92_013292 [Vanilla planifolia]
MSSRDNAAAFAVAHLAVACDGAILGVVLAVCAATSWFKYLTASSALDKIRAVPSACISDLRSLIAASDGEGEDEGKLVVIRGQVQPKSTIETAWPPSKNNSALSSQGSGHRAVILQQTQTCIYNEWRGIFGWSFDLHALFAKSWREQRLSSIRSVPFILVEGGQWPKSGYVHISLDGSTHPLPLATVYHQLRPIQPTPYSICQAIFGNGIPVALLDEEKILAVGKEITAVGMCKLQNGALEMKSCSDLPYFLSNMTKDEIEADLAANSKILFWSGVVLGAFSVGVLGFTVFRNWRRWKEWRRRRQIHTLNRESNVESTADAESGDASDGDVPEGQLCVVCLMRRKRSAFVPCGHLVCCSQCAIYVLHGLSPKCPVCRQAISSSIRIYDS